jgi:hypothetical protein
VQVKVDARSVSRARRDGEAAPPDWITESGESA